MVKLKYQIMLIVFSLWKSMISKDLKYTMTINHWLSIYTSIEDSLLLLQHLALVLNFLETLSDIRIKAFMLLF